MTTAVTVDQLRNLTDRAATGLTPDEQQRLRDGIDALHAELEHARAEADRWAEAESADAAAGSYAGRVEELEAALAKARRLHAQTCPHAQGAARPPAFTCSLCDTLDARPADDTPPGAVPDGTDTAELPTHPCPDRTRHGYHAWTQQPEQLAFCPGRPTPPPDLFWEQPSTHRYLSTGCHHGDHAYCQSMTGLNGAKRPGECKFCQAPCRCGCHTGPEQSGPG